jgi:hypothetical protein
MRAVETAAMCHGKTEGNTWRNIFTGLILLAREENKTSGEHGTHTSFGKKPSYSLIEGQQNDDEKYSEFCLCPNAAFTHCEQTPSLYSGQSKMSIQGIARPWFFYLRTNLGPAGTFLFQIYF